MTEQLNPCPKCGGRKISIWREHNEKCYNLSCVSCNYTLECTESIDQSIERWNNTNNIVELGVYNED